MKLETMRVNLDARPLPAGEAPGELVVFPPGRIETTKTPPFVVDALAGRAIERHFARRRHDHVIDYEHATQFAAERHDGSAPAAGWMKGVRWDAQRGLVAQVEWTERAKRMIEAREYRYFSPVGELVKAADGTLRFVKLDTIGLTNQPAINGIRPLVASDRGAGAPEAAGGVDGGGRMDAINKMLGLAPGAGSDELRAAITDENRAAVAKALGLPETASTEDILMALENKDGKDGAVAMKDAVKQIATRLQLGEAIDTLDGLSAAVSAKLAAAPAPSGYVSMKEHAELAGKVVTLTQANQQREFDMIVDHGAGKGKITPAGRAHMFSVFLANRATFDGLLATMPVVLSERPMLEGRSGGAGGAAPEKRWESDEALRDEFGGDKDAFLAVCKAESDGRFVGK